MAFYEFKKWFFDVSDGMNDYLILFVSQVKLGGTYYTTLQMHGAKRVSQSAFQTGISFLQTTHQKTRDRQMMSFDEGEIRFQNWDCRIRLDFEKCRISLDYRSESPDWPETAALYTHGRASLDWLPLILHGKVSGSVLTNGEEMTFDQAPGYCDEVISTFKPWKVPLSRLYWGRLHHDDINLTFSILQDSKTLINISRLYMDINGNHYVLDGLDIDILNRAKSGLMKFSFPDQYVIRGKRDDLSIRMEVHGHQEMILNDFMDYKNEYGNLAAGLLRWISRNPKGIKFRAFSNISVQINEKEYVIKNVPFVDEYVEFR